MYLACVCVYSTVHIHYLGKVCLLACIYIPPSAAPRLPPGGRARAVRCTKLDPERQCNVGVDALRHAWRDCAKGSHFNHCSRACVGCSHEVKRVRRPLFFFWQMTGEMTTFTYCTSRLPPLSRANTREKKYVITLADVAVIIHGSFTT